MEKSEAIIAVLLVIAIVASVATLVIMNQKASVVTGKASGHVNASISSVVAITLDPDTINFGTVAQGTTHQSGTSGEPASFGIENNGTVKVNITVDSTNPLLTGTSPVYQFKSSCAETNCAAELVDFTTFNQNEQFAIGVLEFAQDKDLANVAVKIVVPMDEPAGSKSDTIVFTASQAE